ncbi:MAG: CpsD/CapB family tyrosine-protein kinase [Clostridia bacterium]|nr:CpsD/CapB family tyrosine-protein kinase [Clostridia bacterium]
MKKSRAHSSLELDARRILSDDSPFGVREAYRALYTNIMYLPIEKKCKKLVMASACPGEGKTLVSINLAYTIAANSPDTKVLLIDGDLRNPRISPLLEIDHDSTHGLSEYLAGIDAEPNFIKTAYPNLSLICSGAESTNTTALLSSARMDKLFALLDEKFDYVIIDTPPITIVSDAVFFSEFTDGFLLVVRADYSDVNTISEAVGVLESVDAKIIGFVLASLDAKKSKKYGRYSGYDGAYGK